MNERCMLTMGTLLSRPLLEAHRPKATWRNEITSRTFQRLAASFCRNGSKWNGQGSFLI
ncbi:hypothetical protein BT69DRAFT_1287500 [Atractiella rhizophila]|nr:hypothetical protein BT69DRAFT_1287500 [Atractiella rhizophila]